MSIGREEMKMVFAHALAVGIAQNAHILQGNVESTDLGRMIHDRAEGFTTGYLEASDEVDDD